MGSTLVLQYGISYRELEGMLEECGIEVDHTTLFYALLIEKRLRWFWRRPISTSWRLDETYIKVKGKWAYCYRAIDKNGRTVDFYLSSTRNAKVAKRFLSKSIKGLSDWAFPKIFNTDKASAYAVAIAVLKQEGKLPLKLIHRQVKYLI